MRHAQFRDCAPIVASCGTWMMLLDVLFLPRCGETIIGAAQVSGPRDRPRPTEVRPGLVLFLLLHHYTPLSANPSPP
jgi:hypothetical protein